MEPNLKDSLRETIGEGENCYLKNSAFVERAAAGTMTKFEKVVQSLFKDHDIFTSHVLNVADLGCSTSPNSFLVMSTVLRTVSNKCREFNLQIPELQFHFNDLPSNDFNTLFKGFSEFRENHEDEEFPTFFCSGVPGSLHDCLFPRKSLHLVHSSYAAHWFSKLPKFVSDEGLLLNKGNLYISKTTPSSVKKEYFSHFEKDFSSFLKVRSEEMVINGLMFLILFGREFEDPADCPSSCYPTDVISQAIAALVLEGLIGQEILDDFNMPLYASSQEEVEEVVVKQGSFAVEHIETMKMEIGVMWPSPQDMMKNFRVYTEAVLAMQFGEEIMDKVYDKAVKIVAPNWDIQGCQMAKAISNVVVLRKN